MTSVLMRHSDIRGCSQINFSLPTITHKCATSFLYFRSEEETQWSFLGNVLLFLLAILDQNRKNRGKSVWGRGHATDQKGSIIIISTPEKEKKHRELVVSARQ